MFLYIHNQFCINCVKTVNNSFYYLKTALNCVYFKEPQTRMVDTISSRSLTQFKKGVRYRLQQKIAV